MAPSAALARPGHAMMKTRALSRWVCMTIHGEDGREDKQVHHEKEPLQVPHPVCWNPGLLGTSGAESSAQDKSEPWEAVALEGKHGAQVGERSPGGGPGLNPGQLREQVWPQPCLLTVLVASAKGPENTLKQSRHCCILTRNPEGTIHAPTL